MTLAKLLAIEANAPTPHERPVSDVNKALLLKLKCKHGEYLQAALSDYPIS